MEEEVSKRSRTLKRWSETGVFFSIQANARPLSFEWILTKPTSSPTFLFNFLLRFNPASTFLGVTFDRTFPFLNVPSLKIKFFPRLKVLRCVSASPWGLSQESLFLLHKAFLRPTHASLRWFPFLGVTNFTELERLHQAASRTITRCLSSSLRRVYFFYESS